MFGCLWKWSIPVYPNDEPILSRLLSLKHCLYIYLFIYLYNVNNRTVLDMTWFGCIDTLSNCLGQPLYHGSYPGIWFSLEHPPFGSPLPAQITTRPVPFKPRSDKDPLVADLQSECSCGCANWSWTMDNGPKKTFYQWSTCQKNRETVGVGSQILFGTPSPTSGTWISHVVYAKQNVR